MILSICILTYKRNHLLKGLLQALLPLPAECELVVVDTTGKAEARELIQQTGEGNINGVFPEERQSISEGRNLALDHASGSWVMFLDDDQVASGAQVLQVLEKIKNEGDALHAAKLAVRPEYLSSRYENWIAKKIKRGHYFGSYSPNEQQSIPAHYLSTDGVVFRHPGSSIRFNEELGFVGGEDNDFFARYLGDKSCEVWTDIVVVDQIMPDRLSLNYIVKDSFRRGCSFAQLQGETLGFSRTRLWWCYSRDLCLSLGLFLVRFCLNQDWPLALGLVVRQYGKLRGLMGVRYALYRDGNSNIAS